MNTQNTDVLDTKKQTISNGKTYVLFIIWQLYLPAQVSRMMEDKTPSSHSCVFKLNSPKSSRRFKALGLIG
jgi:hypothetical protein